MKLHDSAGSPFVRNVMVVAHEHGLVNRIDLAPTTVGPVRANDALAAESPLIPPPS